MEHQKHLFRASLPGINNLLKLFMHFVSDYHVVGLERLPFPPYILTANHLAYWDAPAIGAVIPPPVPGFAAAKYRRRLMGIFCYLGSPIWIEQESPDRHALALALKILSAGYKFAIAPEGTRSKTGALQRGHEGAAYVACRAAVPIVPVAISGTERIFREIRPRVEVTIGRPYRVSTGRVRGEQLADVTDRIMCAIAALLPERYHGYYSGHPYITEMRSQMQDSPTVQAVLESRHTLDPAH